MSKYVAVLGRQPQISVAELEALYGPVRRISPSLAEFENETEPDIARLGGTLKIAVPVSLEEFLESLPKDGKITLGVSEFSKKTSPFMAQKEALKLKKMLVKEGRSVRVVPNQTAVLSNAVSLHNHLFGSERKVELLKLEKKLYKVIRLSNIESYAGRDQKRPARDAKVGMLPPKLAQILINLCGDLPKGARVLDPFCGTGVVLQEAALMGYKPYGTDVEPRMVEYSKKNLDWLGIPAEVEVGDATTFQWQAPVDAVACEAYLGPPMSQIPVDIKFKDARQNCKAIALGFLKNLSEQILPGTPVVIAVPAWLRENGRYEGLNILDEIENLRYNVSKLGQNHLLYHREGQIVAREILVLRKK